MKGQEPLFSSQTTHWSTPIELFQSIHSKINFTVDVCADTTNYKLKHYYTEKVDGLAQDWSKDVCWCNPPYGKTIKDWIEKAYNEAKKGSKIVMLLPARTDTKWFHDYIYRNELAEIVFIKGRLKFSGCKNSAPFPSMLVYFNIDKNDIYTREHTK